MYFHSTQYCLFLKIFMDSLVANSASKFKIDGSRLTQEKNTVSITLIAASGASKRITLIIGEREKKKERKRGRWN